MHAKLFLLFSVLAALSLSFEIPSGTEDGIYLHSVNEDGTESHTRIDISARDVQPLGRSAKFGARDLPLPNPQPKCGYGGLVNLFQGDVDSAVTQLEGACAGPDGKGLYRGGDGQDVYAIHGTVVAYFCNYGGLWCRPDEIQQAINDVVHICGTTQIGYNAGKSFYVTR